MQSNTKKTIEQRRAEELDRLDTMETELSAKYPERGIVEGSIMPSWMDGNPFPGKITVEITCCDCGAIRRISTQDLFQVCRCEACHKAHKRAQKKAKRANTPEAAAKRELREKLEEAKSLAYWTVEAAKLDAKLANDKLKAEKLAAKS